MTMMVAFAVCAVGCGGSDTATSQPVEPTPEEVEALLTSMTTWDAGTIADLDPSGITEVFAPPDSVIIGTSSADLRVVRRKDPNNGCRLLFVDDELRSQAVGLSADAAFFDPCHGQSYRLDGTHVDPTCDRSLFEFAVDVVDGRIIVSMPDADDRPEQQRLCGPLAEH